MTRLRKDTIRIVSLLPAATETLWLLGVRSRLLGVSHECDHPSEVRELPALTASRVDASGGSAEIDRSVRDLVKNGLSLYDIDADRLRACAPDLIVTQDQCDVCAVSLTALREAVDGWMEKPVDLLSLRPLTFDDILADIRRLGEATGTEDKAAHAVTSIRHRVDPLRRAFGSRPTVLCLEWLDPPMVAGHWMPEVVEIAGGKPVIVTDARPFERTTWERLNEADPDYVVLMPCGFPVEKTLNELRASEDGEIVRGLRSLRAVQQGRCYVVDGNAYFNRPGPRIADSCEILAALVHPEKCSPFLNRYRSAIAQWPRC